MASLSATVKVELPLVREHYFEKIKVFSRVATGKTYRCHTLSWLFGWCRLHLTPLQNLYTLDYVLNPFDYCR